MEVFLRDEDGYHIAADESFLDEHVVARLYGVPAEDVQMFRIPSLNVVKISFPRPVSQASLPDRDVHSGQHHVPLALLPLPEHAADWRRPRTPPGAAHIPSCAAPAGMSVLSRHRPAFRALPLHGPRTPPPSRLGTPRWSADELEAVAHALNNRPRKILGRKTPAEVFEEQLRSLQQAGVASTG